MMEKAFITCDICGTIMEGPEFGTGAIFRTQDRDGFIVAATPGMSGYRELFHLAVCQDDRPIELFPGQQITVLFGGSYYSGEMREIDGSSVLGVLIKDHDDRALHAYTMDELSVEQRRYIDSAVDNIMKKQQHILTDKPSFDVDVQV